VASLVRHVSFLSITFCCRSDFRCSVAPCLRPFVRRLPLPFYSLRYSIGRCPASRLWSLVCPGRFRYWSCARFFCLVLLRCSRCTPFLSVSFPFGHWFSWLSLSFGLSPRFAFFRFVYISCDNFHPSPKIFQLGPLNFALTLCVRYFFRHLRAHLEFRLRDVRFPGGFLFFFLLFLLCLCVGYPHHYYDSSVPRWLTTLSHYGTSIFVHSGSQRYALPAVSRHMSIGLAGSTGNPYFRVTLGLTKTY